MLISEDGVVKSLFVIGVLRIVRLIKLKEDPKHPTRPVPADPRTPRQIYMDLHGLTPLSRVQCYICHEHKLMAEMTVHHLVPVELCKTHPWLHHLITTPSNMIAVDGCHEYFNHETVSYLRHENRELKQKLKDLGVENI
jgi:hypothetical protein